MTRESFLEHIDRLNEKWFLGPHLTYKEYLESELWKMRRVYYTVHYGECSLCGTHKGVFNLHHKTYVRLGHEREKDLILLCRKCHYKQHKYKDVFEKIGRERGIWAAMENM